MRVAGVKTLEQANQYLRDEFLPWWNQTLTVEPASADNAHRKLDKQHNLGAILSHVETRQCAFAYCQGKIESSGLRSCRVRILCSLCRVGVAPDTVAQSRGDGAGSVNDRQNRNPRVSARGFLFWRIRVVELLSCGFGR